MDPLFQRGTTIPFSWENENTCGKPFRACCRADRCVLFGVPGSAGDAAAARDDGDPDTTAAVHPWQDHHSNTCGGATRYSASQ